MPSIFSRIVQGEIPCYKIAETDDFLAFLDVKPLVRGHVLAIPKVEVDYIFDLDDRLYLGLNLFARQVAIAIQQTVPCERIATAVIGLEVPHAHIHLIPINSLQDMNFEKQRPVFTGEEMSKLAMDIRANLR